MRSQLYHQLVDIGDDLQRIVDCTLDSRNTRLAVKICLGVGLGAAVGLLSYRLYLKFIDSKLPYKKILNDPSTAVKAKLVHRTALTPHVHRLQFALPTNRHSLRIAPGNGITVKTNIDGKDCSKSFTPVTGEDNLGRTCRTVHTLVNYCVLFGIL